MVEVALCGHATLASAHVIFAEVSNCTETVDTQTQSHQKSPPTTTSTNHSFSHNHPNKKESKRLEDSNEGASITFSTLSGDLIVTKDKVEMRLLRFGRNLESVWDSLTNN